MLKYYSKSQGFNSKCLKGPPFQTLIYAFLLPCTFLVSLQIPSSCKKTHLIASGPPLMALL